MQTGMPRFKIQYSKAAMAYVAKPIRVEKEHEYRQELLTGILDQCERGPALRQLLKTTPSAKEKTIGEHHGAEKPENKTVIEKRLSRFKKNE